MSARSERRRQEREQYSAWAASLNAIADAYNASLIEMDDEFIAKNAGENGMPPAHAMRVAREAGLKFNPANGAFSGGAVVD